MTAVGRIRERRYAAVLAKRERDYATVRSAEERAQTQLSLLNTEWARIAASVPHYRRRIEHRELPRRFDSLEDFVRQVPATTRPDIHGSLSDRTSAQRPPDFRRITGGSTAEPVQLPAWNSEQVFTRVDLWLGRGEYGVTPSSRLFLLWGHSHLLGAGVAGWLRARRLEWSDRLLGYHRHSAYDMRPERLHEAGEALLRFRPDYVVGYSVALARFAAANAALRNRIRSLGVRVVVGAAEAFPNPDAVSNLEDLFACPVGMEYGSVETGLVAHTTPAGGYRVFWRSYLLDAERSDGGWRLRVTSLYPRCFPLVRYDLGDEVDLGPGTPDSPVGMTRIERVMGRCNDFVELQDGTVVHSEAFTHVVRSCPEIRAYQIVQNGPGLRIDYLAPTPLSDEATLAVRERLRRIHPDLEKIPVQRVDDLHRTIAGKTRMVVTE